MKKLIITMGALAMFSLVAQAVEPLKGDVDFDDYEVGAGIPIETQENGFLFWAGNNGESIVTEENGRKFLKVDTTEGLQRKTTADEKSSAEEGADKFNPADIPGDGGNITISSEVQFTAAEDAPTPDQGDKLIVWAKAPTEEGGAVKLMVTDKTGAHETDTVVAADTWYNLQIVSVATGAGLTTSTEFTVKISQGEDEPVAVTVGREEATFVSCLRDGDPAAHTIESVGFKGTGAVDNIAFTKEEGIVAEKFSFTATVNDRTDVPGLSSMTYSVDDGTETALKSGDVVEILCTAQAVTVTAIVYDDSEVTTEGFVKGEEAIALEDGTVYKWTKTISVAGTEADAKVAIDITIRAISGGDEPTPVEPSTSGSVTVTATSEADAISKVALTAPAGVANADAYKAMFAMSATDKGDGTWTVTATLTADGETTLQASVDEAVKVAEILDAKVGTVTIKAVDGFYYYIVGGTEVKAITVNGEAKQAVGATSVELKKPELGETDKAFYRVKVSVMNPAAE